MTTTIAGPGPVAALTGIARHGFLDTVGDAWRTHGDIFRLRLGVGELVIAVHPDAVREENLTIRRAFDKRKSFDGVRRYLTGDGLIASNGDLWRRQRKLMAPFFTPRGVLAYAGIILADALRVEDRWASLAATGETIDMGEEMMELTAAIIVRALFGTAADDEIVRLKGCVETMIRFTTRRMGPHLPDWVPTRSGREYARARDEVHAYIRRIIAERRSLADPPTGDLLAKLMTARGEDGEPMAESLLRDESITMFFAGHETTARTMAATWAALAANPEVEERLGAELAGVLGDREPTVEDLRNLPYALQVV